MNQLNEMIRVVRIRLEAEKKQENPNWSNIVKLESELESLLDQVVMK